MVISKPMLQIIKEAKKIRASAKTKHSIRYPKKLKMEVVSFSKELGAKFVSKQTGIQEASVIKWTLQPNSSDSELKAMKKILKIDNFQEIPNQQDLGQKSMPRYMSKSNTISITDRKGRILKVPMDCEVAKHLINKFMEEL